jgi:hypothetical protein
MGFALPGDRTGPPSLSSSPSKPSSLALPAEGVLDAFGEMCWPAKFIVGPGINPDLRRASPPPTPPPLCKLDTFQLHLRPISDFISHSFHSDHKALLESLLNTIMMAAKSERQS